MKQVSTNKKDFRKATIPTDQQKEVKGGKQSLPSVLGSTGYVDWGEIDVREDDEPIIISTVGFGG